MASTEQINKLVEARTQSLKQALEDQDIDKIVSWHAEESKFFDPRKPYPLPLTTMNYS